MSRTPGHVYVGCFTTAQRRARGDGLHVYAVDSGSGAWTRIQCLDGLENPSYLVLGRDGRFLYAVHGDLDYATSFAIDPETGRIRELNRAATGGTNGVRQAIDSSGRFMIVANYASGEVAVLGIGRDGRLHDQHQLVPLSGTLGPHRTQQTSAHPHDVVFDPSGRFVLVPDKGLDCVFAFRFDGATGRLAPTAQGSVASRPGAAPRHLAFHPTLPVFWVLNELDSTVATHGFDPGTGAMRPIQVLTTLPADFFAASTTAEIAVAPDGRHVYCSNRGANSVAVFAADGHDGTLAPLGHTPSGGRDPRFIGIDPTGRFLHAANEQGDTVVAFRRDPETGLLSPTGEVVRQPSPVTIAFR